MAKKKGPRSRGGRASPKTSQRSVTTTVTPSPAFSAAFSIPEVFESILLQLDQGTLLTSAQRVCRAWHRFITTSPQLQRHLFLLPAAQTKQHAQPNPLLEHLLGPLLFAEPHIITDPPGPSGPYAVIQRHAPPDILSLKLPMADMRSQRRHHEAFLRAGASWRRMLPSQPPPTEVLHFIHLTPYLDNDHLSAVMGRLGPGTRVVRQYTIDRARWGRHFHHRLVFGGEEADGCLRMGLLYDMMYYLLWGSDIPQGCINTGSAGLLSDKALRIMQGSSLVGEQQQHHIVHHNSSSATQTAGHPVRKQQQPPQCQPPTITRWAIFSSLDCGRWTPGFVPEREQAAAMHRSSSISANPQDTTPRLQGLWTLDRGSLGPLTRYLSHYQLTLRGRSAGSVLAETRYKHIQPSTTAFNTGSIIQSSWRKGRKTSSCSSDPELEIELLAALSIPAPTPSPRHASATSAVITTGPITDQVNGHRDSKIPSVPTPALRAQTDHLPPGHATARSPREGALHCGRYVRGHAAARARPRPSHRVASGCATLSATATTTRGRAAGAGAATPPVPRVLLPHLADTGQCRLVPSRGARRRRGPCPGAAAAAGPPQPGPGCGLASVAPDAAAQHHAGAGPAAHVCRVEAGAARERRLWDRMMLPGMTVGGGRDDENGDDHDAGDDADMNKSNGNNSNNADIDERLLRQSEHGGMTWFNFARDVLYIGHNGSDFAPEQRDYPRLLLHSQPWDVSVFLPHDLARVTRLALPGASSMAGSTWFAHVPHAYMGLVDHLRLFPRLKELLLAEWALLGGHLDDDGDDVHVVVDAETGAGLPDGPSPQQVHRDRIARASETWFYLPMRDIDAFSPRVYKMEDGQQATAVAAMALQMHSVLKSQHPWVPRRGGAGSSAAGRLPDEEEEEEAEEEEAHSFLAQQTRLWTADLATLAGQPPLGGGLGGLPRLPAMKTMLRITLAHVGTEDMLEALQAERQAVWAGIVASDDGDAVSGAQVRRDSVDIFSARPIMPPPFDRQIGWTSEKVCPPRREQVVWSVVDKGMMRDAVDIGNLEFSLDPQV
ncbi:uncharacterized protein B0I36DRAFT_353106 [Microdochium trichocladiopsis]|uniref:F-box domain-containing protein n=1 Tax=Microdochium trichocladiopsis TaxID=1682393 RepID=A0A9P8Y145_9PEZI|nr:uncharacterized protein B0I36DRAFT_353106 [Microdochium trichocladiopsis]KAH7024921.1 hypothetical protein B0I36DRAFT_353106 [Microdochium trichocladiopsis]